MQHKPFLLQKAVTAVSMGPLFLVVSGLFAQTAGSKSAIGPNAITFQALPVEPPTTAARFEVLYTFTGSNWQPNSALVRDKSGNLYGTAEGEIYRLDITDIRGPAGNLFGTSLTVLYWFCSLPNCTDGYGANGVIRDPAGNLLGTTQYGGNSDQDGGVVYRLSASGKETVLHTFGGAADGAHSEAPLVEDAAGNLYGTTLYGGTANYGTVFKVTKGQESVMHSFAGSPADGYHPVAPLILDSKGNLYGTTWEGGTYGYGVVFKLDPTANEAVLYNFLGGTADGANPYAGVIFDSEGNLYGTTEVGGSGNQGVVYKLDMTTGIETVLHNFTGESDGFEPTTGVVFDSEGNLYGTTTYGGTEDSGVLYEITAAGEVVILHEFTAETDGALPNGVIYSEGVLYGTTYYGGTNGYGVIFRFKL
jgi:uncharacterized repeat protein (TIGR03803 family)